MPRISRKIQDGICEKSAYRQKTTTAIYVRLSVLNSGKTEEKDVIANQIAICKEFLSKQSDLSLYGIYEDNGTTGTIFDRPNFNRLMEDIKAGKVSCLIVRDLSRFGRDYIEAGIYIEKIFPSLGVRFISVKENYDSIENDVENNNLMIPLQNMINTLYSKDISKKVISAHQTRMSDSNFKKSIVAYGYKLDESRRKIIIDEECAKYVKLIFSWKIEQIKITEIAKKLDALKAPLPNVRKSQTGVRKNKNVGNVNWNRCTVNNILSNSVYLGDTIVGKTKTALYKGIARHTVNCPNSLKVYENTHQAIISKEQFELVQKIIKVEKDIRKDKFADSEKMRNSLINLFENKIFCADCKKKMYFKKENKKGNWYAVYKCSSYTRKLNTTCNSHYIISEEVKKIILQVIKTQVKVGLDYEKLVLQLKYKTDEKSIRDKYNTQIKSLTLKINNLNKKGIEADKEEYNILVKRLEKIITQREEFKEMLETENKWDKLMKPISKADKLTSELVDAVIDAIYIYSDGTIEIKMKFNDIFI